MILVALWQGALFAQSVEFAVRKEPIATLYTPDSVLQAPPGNPIYAAERSRYSTCPGITWAQQDQFLITANYLGRFVGIFSANLEENLYQFKQRLGNAEGMQLGRAADVSLSQDGRLLAVGNSGTTLNIYSIEDCSSCTLTSQPLCLLGELSSQRMHGVTFSSDSNYLVYTTIDDPDQICIYRVIRKEDGSVRFQLTQHLENLFHPRKPKSIAFSHDNKYAVVCFSERSQQYLTYQGIIVSYAFDAETGTLNPNPVCVTESGAGVGLMSPEGIIFSSDDRTLLVADQILDTVSVHAFDLDSGQIGNSAIALQNPEANLSFPHGLALSSDGSRLAVTNLGEDKINIYSVDL